jgi:integrase
MFTDRYIRNLKPEEKIKDIREKRGFGVRVRPDGVKIFFYRYTSPVTGARRFLTLGEYPKPLSLEDARIEYGKAFEAVKSGIDPLETKHHEQEERRKAPTVEKLCEEYIDRHAKRFKRSWGKDERILSHDVIPAWGKRKAADISKRDVVLLLEKIVDRGSPGMANNTFQVIRKMFNWSVEQDILTNTPCVGVKLPTPKQSRDRVLTEAEIKTFWGNLDTCAMSGEIRRALRLILLTAQRPGEVIGMHTSEIDGDWWTIPAERSKNGKANRVPLTPLVKEIIAEGIEEIKQLRELPTGVEYKGFIFPSPIKRKVQPVAGQALIVAVARNLSFPLLDAKGKPLFQKDGTPATENRLGVEKFTPHDLRRTAATFMAEMGTMDEVIDAILNHAKQGVIKVYNQYRYDREKQLTLESWERKVNSILTSAEGKVISIQQGKKKAANH